jgi:hypothetical protein
VLVEFRLAPETPTSHGIGGGPPLAGALGGARAHPERSLEGKQALSTRSMIAMPSIIDLLARSYSATTSTSPVPSASMAFSSSGWPFERLAGHLLGEDLVASFPAERAELAIQVLRRGAHPRVADLAQFAPRNSCLNCWPAET